MSQTSHPITITNYDQQKKNSINTYNNIDSFHFLKNKSFQLIRYFP